MAQDVLFHHCIIDDEIDAEEVRRDYKWDKK
jgi:hypothetical protein